MQSNAMAVFGIAELLENVLDHLTDHELVQALTQNVKFRNSIIASPILRSRLPIQDSYERIHDFELQNPSRKVRAIDWWKVRELGLYSTMARNPFIANAVDPVLSSEQRRELYLDQDPAPEGWSQMWLQTSDRTPDRGFKWYANPHLVNGASLDRRAVMTRDGNTPWFVFQIPQAPGIVYSLTSSAHHPKSQKFAALHAYRDPSSMPFAHTIQLTRMKGNEHRSPPLPVLQEFQLDMFLISCKVPFMMRVCDKAGLNGKALETWIVEGTNTSIFCPAGTEMRHLAAWTEAWAQGAEGDLSGVASNGISEIDESDWLLQEVLSYEID